MSYLYVRVIQEEAYQKLMSLVPVNCAVKFDLIADTREADDLSDGTNP